jgi:hypothetical protein
MTVTLKGFQQTDTVRQFSFECVVKGNPKTMVTVGADLNLARKYRIPPQDLPLYCRRLVESSEEVALPESLVFTEQQMADVRSAITATAAEKKPAKRNPPSERVGHAWRGAKP